jgi:hypothetical protein
MNELEIKNFEFSDMKNSLELLLKLLKSEHNALLKGDAKLVASINDDKLKISLVLEEGAKKADAAELTGDLALLAKEVGILAKSNHLLIEQMTRHYNGMVELFIKIAGGQMPGYGPDGTMGRLDPSYTGKRHEIIA